MRFSEILIGVAAVATVAASCSDSSGPDSSSGIRLISGYGVSDTVDAQLSQALVVEVHDSTGQLPPKGTVVRFNAVASAGYYYEALVMPLTGQYPTNFATAETDDIGRAAVIVKLGVKAGTAHVAISVPTLNAQDTAEYTILPGKAASALVTPLDTTLYAGHSYTLRGGVVDRYGNARTDPTTWSISGPGASVTAAGVVTASAVGRYTISGTTAAGTATGHMSVVPQMRLAGWRTSPDSRIVSAELDGSDQKVLAPVVDGGIGAHPAWMPDGTIIYTYYDLTYQALRTVGDDGVVKQFFTTTPATVTHQADPAPSRTGGWVYFAAFDSNCASSSHYCLYRAKTDASLPQLLGTMVGTTATTRQPAPSPDGSLVAYVIGEWYETPQIRVLDVAATSVSSWSINGTYPSWSPDGTKIAFISSSSTLNLIDANGANAHALTPAAHSYTGPIGWSPDGQWIIARGPGLLELVRVSDALALPLGYSTSIIAASVR